MQQNAADGLTFISSSRISYTFRFIIFSGKFRVSVQAKLIYKLTKKRTDDWQDCNS